MSEIHFEETKEQTNDDYDDDGDAQDYSFINKKCVYFIENIYDNVL